MLLFVWTVVRLVMVRLVMRAFAYTAIANAATPVNRAVDGPAAVDRDVVLDRRATEGTTAEEATAVEAREVGWLIDRCRRLLNNLWRLIDRSRSHVDDRARRCRNSDLLINRFSAGLVRRGWDVFDDRALTRFHDRRFDVIVDRFRFGAVFGFLDRFHDRFRNHRRDRARNLLGAGALDLLVDRHWNGLEVFFFNRFHHRFGDFFVDGASHLLGRCERNLALDLARNAVRFGDRDLLGDRALDLAMGRDGHLLVDRFSDGLRAGRVLDHGAGRGCRSRRCMADDWGCGRIDRATANAEDRTAACVSC